MDLRRRLIGTLGLLLGSLLAIIAALQLVSLRSDIDAEVEASTRLVAVLAAAGNLAPGAEPALERRLAAAGLRHLSIRRPGQPAAGTAPPHPLVSWLGLAPPVRAEQAIRIGSQLLFIAPNPRSEIDERLGDTVQIWNTLLFFFGTTLVLTWWCADRALKPVRELEASLHRLARGEPDPALPAFVLREFGRVARAIEHLAGALRDARAAQRDLARQLIAVQEEERRTLARELHDEMGQTMTALGVTAAHLARNAARLTPAAVAECANDLRRDVRTCTEQLRALLKTLRPHGLDGAGLGHTLRELVQGWRGRHTNIDFALELPEPMPPIGDAMALVLYRVVQEALTNAVRHSGARRCTVRLAAGPARLALEIVDDGCGLPPASRPHGGLLGMQERIGMAGGQLHVLPNPGGGLRLRALFPLAPDAVQAPAAEAALP